MALQPVAVSFDVHHLAMVEQPVENGRSDHRIAEEFLPVSETLVGRDDRRAFLVAVRDKLEKEVSLLAGLVQLVLDRLDARIYKYIQASTCRCKHLRVDTNHSSTGICFSPIPRV